MRVRVPDRRRKALTLMVFRIDTGVTVKSSPRTRMRVLPSNHSSHGYLLTDFRRVSAHTLSLTTRHARWIRPAPADVPSPPAPGSARTAPEADSATTGSPPPA